MRHVHHTAMGQITIAIVKIKGERIPLATTARWSKRWRDPSHQKELAYVEGRQPPRYPVPAIRPEYLDLK